MADRNVGWTQVLDTIKLSPARDAVVLPAALGARDGAAVVTKYTKGLKPALSAASMQPRLRLLPISALHAALPLRALHIQPVFGSGKSANLLICLLLTPASR